MMEEYIRDPPIPYIGPILGGTFSPGKIIKIQGIVPATSYRFNINLQCGSETIPRSDIAMHFAIHLLDGHQPSINSCEAGIWGEKQLHIVIPIKRVEKFEICIKCHFNQYEILINGQHFCYFPQRIHYARITHLAIDGDVSIIQISSTLEEDRLPQATAPAPTLQLPNQTDDFVNLKTVSTPPPSYDVATEKSQIGFSNEISFAPGPPYPTTSPYPHTSAPYPLVPAPYPTKPGAMPIPVANPYNVHDTQTPYPTAMSSYYPSAGVRSVPPPPAGRSVPLNATSGSLNAASSNFRPMPRNSNEHMGACCAIAGAIIGAMILASILVTTAGQLNK